MRLPSAKRYLWLPTLFALVGTAGLCALAAWSMAGIWWGKARWQSGAGCLVYLNGGWVILLTADGQPRGKFFLESGYVDRASSPEHAERVDGYLPTKSPRVPGILKVAARFPLLALVPLLWLWPGWRAWRLWRRRREGALEPPLLPDAASR